MRPPTKDKIVASIRNCDKITRLGAPIAFLIPISRVLSITVTSMMLVIPMPPTSSEIPATAPRRTVNVLLDEADVESSDA